MTQASTANAVSGGFAAPVFAAQKSFRAIMEALARPCKVQTLDDTPSPPGALSPGLGAALLTLCDAETPVWLSPSLDRDEVRAWIAFHSAAPLTTEAASAAFAFVGTADILQAPSLNQFAAGTDQYPDRSTTLILEVALLSGGAPLRLRGPGIETSTTIAPTGLPAGFVAQRTANRALFPRGVDVLLVAGREIVGLPRSTVVEPLAEPGAS